MWMVTLIKLIIKNNEMVFEYHLLDIMFAVVVGSSNKN